MVPLQRGPMCAMMSVQNLFIYGVRYGYPLLVPFIVSECGYSEAQRASLLAAFTPGYIVTQIPGGLLAARVGGKAVLTWISYAMIGLLLALPAAVSRSLSLARLCLFGIGLAQAPLRPAQQLMTYNWVPYGTDRAYNLMVISLGSALAKTAAAVALPTLCARFGWRSAVAMVSALFGVFNLAWQLLGTELPELLQSYAAAGTGGAPLLPAPEPEPEPAAPPPPQQGTEETLAPTISEMFWSPPFQSIIWSHTCKDLIDVHTFGLWAPSFLHLRHGVPLGRVRGTAL